MPRRQRSIRRKGVLGGEVAELVDVGRDNINKLLYLCVINDKTLFTRS